MTPIFELTPTTTDNILAYAGQLISDAMPLLVIILGIGIGLWVIGYFIRR